MGAPAAPRQPLPPALPPQQYQAPAPTNPGYAVVNPTVEITPQVLPKSALNPVRCPACNGGNYPKVGMGTSQNGSFDVHRCYDCGYPKVQAGSGVGTVGGSSSGGPATPAKQVATGGFNPTTIIGHI
jgi:hypothetical protein